MTQVPTEFIYRERPVPWEFADVISRAWYLHGQSPQPYERILPLPFQYLIVNLGEPYRVLSQHRAPANIEAGGAFVVGIQDGAVVNHNPAILHHVGFEIRPGSLLAIARSHVGSGIVSFESLQPAAADVARAASGDDAVAGTLAALASLRDPQWRPHPGLERALATVGTDPTCGIGDVARQVGVTPKTLTTWFVRHCGIAPKKYADVVRLHRFVTALPSMGERVDWARVAAEAGYYDQPHFIRAFTRMTSMTPRAFAKQWSVSEWDSASFLALDEFDAGDAPLA